MDDKVISLSSAQGKQSKVTLCPPDLTGRWATAFQDLADIVSTQSGLVPADGEMIAAVVRSQRRALMHETLAIDALQAKDMDEFAAQSRLANSAASSVRAGLTQLKAHPGIRAGRATKAKMGEMALESDDDWRDLL